MLVGVPRLLRHRASGGCGAAAGKQQPRARRPRDIGRSSTSQSSATGQPSAAAERFSNGPNSPLSSTQMTTMSHPAQPPNGTPAVAADHEACAATTGKFSSIRSHVMSDMGGDTTHELRTAAARIGSSTACFRSDERRSATNEVSVRNVFPASWQKVSKVD